MQTSDFDTRQLNLMMRQLNSFESGEIDLSSLQSSLEFLLHVMNYVDDSWETSFLVEISTLASINAGIPNDIQIDIQPIITKTVENLKKLVKQAAYR